MVSKKELFFYIACIIIIIVLSALTKITVESADQICDDYCKLYFDSNCVEGAFYKGGCDCWKPPFCPYFNYSIIDSVPTFPVNFTNNS